MPNEIMQALEAAEDDIRREAAVIVARKLRAAAPRDTGQLKRSIRPTRDGEVLMAAHGVYQNARGRHRGWIQRAV